MNRKYSPELKAEAVRVVLETSRPVTSVAAEFGVGAESLRTWVNKQRAAETASDGARVPRESAEEQVTRLQRENRDLRMELEFMGKAAAFFAKEYR